MRTLYEGIYAQEAPAHIKRLLLARGGVNPHGEPNYRLVKAKARKRLSGGRWVSWAAGTPQAQRNDGRYRPLKTEVCYIQIPVYPTETGWVLERWFPPDLYGTPELWNLPQSLGGTVRFIDGISIAAFGDFPSRGDYEHAGFVFPEEAVTEAIIGNAVGMIERRLCSVSQNQVQRALEEINAQEAEHNRQLEGYETWARDVLDQEGNIFDARTPGGQAEVCRLAESIGIRSHPF